MCYSIYSIEISHYVIIDPIKAFELAKELIQENSLNGAFPRGIKNYEINHTEHIYRYVSLPKYKGKLEKEEFQPGINVYWTVPSHISRFKSYITNNSLEEGVILESKLVPRV
jgi:hypothetical protein